MIRATDLADLDFEVLGDAESCAVIVQIAETDDGEPFASVLCRGITDRGGGFVFMELGFEVQLIASNGEIFTTQQREVVRQYLPEDIRAQILPLVCRCYAAILTKFRPGFVYRVCAYPNLPDAALVKHEVLTKAVIDCGYFVFREGTDEDDRTFWLCGASN